MSNAENLKAMSDFKTKNKLIRCMFNAMTVILVVLSVLVFVPFNQIRYDNAWEELYEHQAEYLMNEPQDFEDLFDRDEFCNFVDINFEQGGKWLEKDGVLYFQDLKVTFKNNSNRDFSGVIITIPYVDYDGAIGTFGLSIGEVGANGEYVVKEVKMPRLCKVEKVCRVSEERVSNAVCYAIERGDEMLSPYQAEAKVDVNLIRVLIGDRPEPIFSYIEKSCVSFVLIVIALVSIAYSKKYATELRKFQKGEFKIQDGKVIINEAQAVSPTLINTIEGSTKEDPERTEKTLPADFGDGHKTTHDCGGFEINQDDFKIDPNDYK